jgi:LPXTG-motif cell wall-anchored protein
VTPDTATPTVIEDGEPSATATQECQDCQETTPTATPKPRRHRETGSDDNLPWMAVGGLITLAGAAIGFWGMRRRRAE